MIHNSSCIHEHQITDDQVAGCCIPDTPTSCHLILQWQPLIQRQRSWAPLSTTRVRWHYLAEPSAEQRTNNTGSEYEPKLIQTSPQQEQSIPKQSWSKTHFASTSRPLRSSTYKVEEWPDSWISHCFRQHHDKHFEVVKLKNCNHRNVELEWK